MLEMPKLPIQAAAPAPSANANSANSQNRAGNSAETGAIQGTQGNKTEKAQARQPETKDKLPGSQAQESFARALERQLAKAGTHGKPVTGLALAAEHCASRLLGEMRELSPLAGNTEEALPAEETLVIDNLAGVLPALPQIVLAPTDQTTEDAADTEPSLASDDSATKQSWQQALLNLPAGKDEKLTASTVAANIAEAPRAASNKTAEFAAAATQTANTLPQQDSRPEPAKTDTSFENMLTALQAAHFQRGNEASATRTAAPQQMQTPVNQPGWDNEVADKLVWMVGRQEQRAELVINPPQLGRVEITLSISNDQTNAIFVSANPAVREILESALPHLREILADAGISLGQAQVGAESQQDQARQSANNRENRDNSARGVATEDIAQDNNLLQQIGATHRTRQGNGMVDIFA